MRKEIKKILCVFLIVATIVTNTGFLVLAGSIEDTVSTNLESQQEIRNYYYEMEYEKETIVEEYETYLEEANPDVSDSSREEVEEVLEDLIEEPEEDFIEEEEDLIEEEVKEEVNDEITKNETKEETEEVDNEDIASNSDVIDFDEENIVLEDIEELEEDESKEKEIEDIASESEIFEVIEEETATESEIFEVIEEETATESEIFEIVDVEATESEVDEIATESEVKEIATESEIISTISEVNASSSEAKEILVATMSKIIWKVKKFYVATVSRTQVKSFEKEERRLLRLATIAELTLINNKNEEKSITIPLKWKLFKEIEVNAVGGEHEKAIPVETLREQFKVDEIIKTGSDGVLIATENEVKFIKQVQKIADEAGKELVVVEKIASESEIIENIVVVSKENSIEEKFVDENKKIISTESEVSAFSETEASKSEIDEVITGQYMPSTEQKEEIKKVTTHSETDIEKASTSESAIEESTSSEIKESIVEKLEIREDIKKYYDLRTIYLYKLDEKAVSKEIMNVINTFDDDEGKEESNVVKDFFNGLFSLFGLNGVEEKTTNTEDTKNQKEANIDILDSAFTNLVVEFDSMRFGSGEPHSGEHDVSGSSSHQYISIADTDNDLIDSSANGELALFNKNPGETTKGISGVYYLPTDLTITNKWQIATGYQLTICLYGHNLKFATAGCIVGDGRINICNCRGTSHVGTNGPQYNWHDQFYASTSETYTKYNEKPLFEADIVNVIAHTKGNIVFDGSQIKNCYSGKLVASKMQDTKEDLPEISGGASLIHATQKLQTYGVNFTNNKAIRTNGTVLNAQLAEMVVESCNFKNNVNVSNRGGAIAFNPDGTVIYDCTFEGNQADTLGGALYGRVYANKGITLGVGTKIQKTTFKDNVAGREGGAIFLDYIEKVEIEGVEGIKTFDGNIAGVAGGAIAINQIKAFDVKENIPWDNKPTTTAKKTFNLNNVTFSKNEAHALKLNADKKYVEDTGANLNQNYGGAIYVNNRPSGIESADPSVRYNERIILDEINIKGGLFEENLAKGEKLDIAATGIASEVYYFNNYGGAIYAKGVDNINIEDTEFNKNYSLTGGAICLSEESKLTMKSGKITNCGAYNDTNTTKIEERIVSPGGGAIYLMDSKASFEKDVVINNNVNAIYLAQGSIDLGAKDVKDNKGEYLIGFNNDLENKILFSGVDIREQTFRGREKDYTRLNPHMALKNTTISFKDVNTITKNKIIPIGGSDADAYICNLDMRSSISNLKLDLKDYSFKTNRSARIGLHYDINCNEIFMPDGGQYDPPKFVDDGLIVYDKWNAVDSKVFAEGTIWTSLFTLDNAENTITEPLAKEWKYYAEDGCIKVSPYVFTVKFETYFEDEDIEPQYYNYKLGSKEEIKISTPTELFTNDGTEKKYNIVGFMGQDKASKSVLPGRPRPDPTKWVNWNFDECRMLAELGVKEGILVAVYTDNTVKMKACGCPSGTLCNHENGVQHIDRGIAPSTSTENKYKNYIAIATPVHLGYLYTNPATGEKYRTQYVLEKDINLTQDEAREYLRGDVVLNLNSHVLSYDTSVTDEVLIDASVDNKRNYFTEIDAATFISGIATTADVPRGKITSNGNHKAPFIDPGETGAFISNVDIENIVNTTVEGDSCFIERATKFDKDDKQYTTFENVNFNNIDVKADFIKNVSKLIFKNVKINGEFKLPSGADNYAIASLQGGPNVTKKELRIVETDIKNIEEVSSIFEDEEINNASVEITIASSSIDGNKFKKGLIDTSKTAENSTISFIGKNNIMNNIVTNATHLLNLSDGQVSGAPLNVVFGNEDSENIFENNTVPDVASSTIIHITKRSKVTFKGKNKFSGNKAAANTKETSTVYQDKGSQVEFSNTAINVIGNNTKYNWYVENSDISKMKTIVGEKFTAKDSKIAIRVQDITIEEPIYDDWSKETISDETIAENIIVQDPSYQTESDPDIKRAAAYKWTKGTPAKREIYFGKEYATGTFKLYNYQAEVDERTVNGGNNYDHDVAEKTTQRIRKNALTDLDKPDVTPPQVGDKIMWEGLKYDTDIRNEEFYGFDIKDLKVNTEDDFEITGYIVRERHQHDGEDILPIEVRNEGHLQATESMAFLHNDLTITRPLTKLTGDFVLCLNGHKLTFDKNLTWVDVVGTGRKVIIYNCPTNEPAIITSKTDINIATPFIAVEGGADFKMSNIKIDKLKATESFVKVTGNGKANIDKLTINESNIDFSKKTTEAAFISLANTVDATYSNLSFTKNTVKTYEGLVGAGVGYIGMRQSIMSLKQKTSGVYSIPKINIEENTVYGKGNVVRITANGGDINVGDEKLTVKKNKTSSGTPVLFISDVQNAKTHNINMKNPTFEANMKALLGSTDPSPQPLIYAATFGLDTDYSFSNLNIDGGLFKENGFDTTGNIDNSIEAYSVMKIDRVDEANIKNVEFDNNAKNTTTYANGYALLVNEANNVTFDNCMFIGGTNVGNGYIKLSQASRNVKFINGTKFENIKALNVIEITDRVAPATTYIENVTFSGIQAENIIKITGTEDSIKEFIASNSTMTDNKATEIYVDDAKLNMTLQNFTIQSAGDTLVNHKGINAVALNKITVNEKITIKGHRENLAIRNGVKLDVGVGYKILDGSEIYITIPNDASDPDVKFFEKWNPTYIEKYGYHRDTKIAYLPTEIFKFDDALKNTNVIYRGGDSDLYAATKTSDNFATLDYVDEEIIPSTTPLIKQYVKINEETKVDRVYVWYLSTSSQVWIATVLPNDTRETWNVTEDHTVNLLEKKVYKIFLTKKHIHKICGPDVSYTCSGHLDNANHTEELDFYSINSDIELYKTIASINNLPSGDEKKHYYFGLNADITVTQESLDELNGKEKVTFCLQGKVLTFDSGATLYNTKDIIITNCESTGYITVKDGHTTATIIKSDQKISLYNVIFKNFTTSAPVIDINADNHNLLMENVTFDGITNTNNSQGLVGLSAIGQNPYIGNLTFINNVASGSGAIFTINNGLIDNDNDITGRITTISFIKNKYHEKLIDIEGETKLRTINISENSVLASSTVNSYAALYVNANTTFTQNTMISENISEERTDAKGAAVYVVNGKMFKVEKDLTISKNKAVKGAGLYLDGTINILGKLTLNENNAIETGAAIYKTQTGNIVTTDIMFDNNIGKSVVAYEGSLNLIKPTFINHTNLCDDLIVSLEENTTIDIASPTYIRNNINGAALKLNKSAAESKVYGITIQTNNNNFSNFIELNDSCNFTFEKSEIKGNSFGDSVIKISTPGNVVLKDITISGNTVTNAAVYLAHGFIEVQGKVIVDGNPTSSGTEDIFISDDDSYVKATTLLDEGTKLAFYPYKNGIRVFSGWSAAVFSHYGIQDTTFTDSRKFAYTPENSGMLVMSGKSITNNYNIYKKGTLEDIFVGKENVDFVKISFVDEENLPYKTYGSQNIAKDFPTRFEKIDTHEVALNKQTWMASVSDATATWCFDIDVIASISNSEKAYYQRPHLHGTTEEYFGVTNANELATNTHEYLVLKADIDVYNKLEINPALKGLCLNGHAIILRSNDETSASPVLTINGDLDICDCQGTGKITMKANEYRYGDIIRVTSGTVNISVPFDNIKLKSTISDTTGANVIDVRGGDVTYTYATISNVSIDSGAGLLCANGGNINITSLLAQNNKVEKGSLLRYENQLKISRLEAKGNIIGTASMIVLNTTNTIENVIVEDNQSSCHIDSTEFIDIENTINVTGDFIVKGNEYTQDVTEIDKANFLEKYPSTDPEYVNAAFMRTPIVRLAANMQVGGNVVFEENKGNTIGALYIRSGKLSAGGKIEFINNEAPTAVALLNGVKGLPSNPNCIEAVNGIVFDGNKEKTATVKHDDWKGIVNSEVSLKLHNAVFKNHTAVGSQLIEMTDESAALAGANYISNVSFVDNNISGAAMAILFTSATLSDVEFSNNKFAKAIDVYAGNALTLKNVNLSDVNCSDTVVGIIAYLPDANITFEDEVKITNANSSKPALSLINGSTIGEVPIKVKGTYTIGKIDLTSNETTKLPIFFRGIGMISKESSMTINSVTENGYKIFEGWSATNIERYDTPDSSMTDSRKYAYTPENSGLFVSSKEDYQFYKEGTTSQIVYIGTSDKYSVVTFRFDPTDPLEEEHRAVYCTQNITKGVPTRLDKVDMLEYDLNDQEWLQPIEPSGRVIAKFNPDIIVTYNGAQNIQLIEKHIHKVCGVRKTEICTHDNGEDHGINAYVYYPIATKNDIMNIDSSVEYIMLENDIEIFDSSFIVPDNVKGICLNGHNLVFKKGFALLNSDDTVSYSSKLITLNHDLSICDCKYTKDVHGAIKTDMKTNEATDQLYNDFINAANNKLNVYNTYFDSINIRSNAAHAAVINAAGGNVYLENVTFANTSYLGKDGILMADTGTMKLRNVTIKDFVLDGTSALAPALTINDTMDISTISFIGNTLTYNSENVSYVMVKSGKSVVIDKLIFENNTTGVQRKGWINVPDGSKLTLNEDFEVKDNTTRDKGVVYIAGELECEKGISFVNNVQGGGGGSGALYVYGAGKVRAKDGILFKENASVKHGAAIYGENITENAFGTTSIIFDANKLHSTANSDTHGVVEWTGNLKLVKPIFKNHADSKISLFANAGPGKLTLEEPKFINNTLTKCAMEFKNLQDGSLITGIKGDLAGNKCSTFINLLSGNLALENCDIKGLQCTDTVVKVSGSDVTYGDLTIGTTSIIENKTEKGAVYIDGGQVGLLGKVIVKDNLALSSNPVNVYVGNETSVLKAMGRIDKESKITISAYAADATVFKDWNSIAFEKYDNPDMAVDNEYMYTPEGCGVFIVGSGHTGQEFYTSGDSEANTVVKLGNNFVKLNFVNPAPDAIAPVVGSQNVEKSVNTKLNKIDTFEYELEHQEWYFPNDDLETGRTKKSFYNGDVLVNYGINHDIKYIQKHFHKECGLNVHTECNHDGIVSHGTSVEWYEAENSIDLEDTSHERWFLTKDIEINGQINLPDTCKGICLNGHTITQTVVGNPIFNIPSGVTEITICNCKESGGLTYKSGVTAQNDVIKTASPDMRLINVNIFGIKSNASYVNVTLGAAYIERAKIKNNTSVGSNGSFTGGGAIKLVDVEISENNMTGNYSLLRIGANMIVGTLSVTKNTTSGKIIEIINDNTFDKSLIVENNTTTCTEGLIEIDPGVNVIFNDDINIDKNKITSGGTLHISNSSKVIMNGKMKFTKNESAENGSGIYIEDSGELEVNGKMTFEDNKAKSGSSLYIENAGTAANQLIKFNENTSFSSEQNSVGGAITFGGFLKLEKAEFIANNKVSKALIANIGTIVDSIELNDVKFIDNNLTSGVSVAGKNGIVLSGANLKINGMIVAKLEGSKTNNFDNFILLDNTAAEIRNATISNANTNGSIILAKNGSNVDFYNTVINGNTMKGSVIELVASNASNQSAFEIKGNTSTGAKGSAISIDRNSKYIADQGKLTIQNNTSGNGGAVYLEGKFALEDNEILIDNNKSSGKVRNVYLADENARFVLNSATSKISDKSKIGITNKIDNQVFFENWKNGIVNRNGVVYADSPEKIFVADEEAKASGYDTYKSGIEGSTLLKFGKNYVTLTFQNANKTTIYAKQNVEKGVDTTLDNVKEADVTVEKWVVPADSAASSDTIIQFINIVDVNYTVSKNIVKSFKYKLMYTAGTKEGQVTGDMGSIEEYEYGDTITIKPSTYEGAAFANKWSLRSAVNGAKFDYVPGETAKNLCDIEDGIAYLDARWEGEYMVRFLPNGDRMGIGIAYDERFNKTKDKDGNILVKNGRVILNETYTESLIEDTEKYGMYTTYNTNPDGRGTSYAVGKEIGITEDLYLYCIWHSIYDPNPTPTPIPTPTPKSGGGGGGGGSGGKKNYYSSGMWIDGVFYPTEPGPGVELLPTRGYRVDEYGNIVNALGEVVGDTALGDRVNSNGTFTDRYGNTHNLDGSITTFEGLTYNLDGSITDARGVKYNLDGSIEYPDGVNIDANGMIHRADGSIVTADGTIYYPDGSIEYPDGTIVLINGKVIKKENGVNEKANLEFDPNTGGWKLFAIDENNGTKQYFKDKWVSAINQKGNSTWYLADKEGNIVIGWAKVDGEYYYLSNVPSNYGEVTTGNITIDGKIYRFDNESGRLLDEKNKPKDFYVVGATNHKSGIDGVWKTDAEGNKKFYLDWPDANGTIISVPVSGWVMIDGSYYFFDENNLPVKGLVIFDGKYYYMKEDFTMLEGGEVEVEGVLYSFDKATGACRTVLKM